MLYVIIPPLLQLAGISNSKYSQGVITDWRKCEINILIDMLNVFREKVEDLQNMLSNRLSLDRRRLNMFYCSKHVWRLLRDMDCKSWSSIHAIKMTLLR